MMVGMNPFDAPPSGDPLSFEPPSAPESSGPGRGRMVLVAVLTAGLIGGGVAAVSQFASADQPDLAVAAPDEPSDETIPPVDDEEKGDTDEPAEPTGESEGQIVIDHGDGEPIVIDLGDVEGDLARLSECVGLPMFGAGEFEFGEWEPGELPNFEEFFEDLPFDLEALEDLEGQFGQFDESGEFGMFEDGGSVTVAGPDGVSVIDLGENGSVTVTKADGEISVETDGDATVTDLEEVFGGFEGMIDEMFADGGFEGMIDEMFADGEFDEFLETLPDLEELSELESIDPEAVQSCLDEVLGN